MLTPLIAMKRSAVFRPELALYYSPLIRLGGAERQWAEELRAFRAAGVQAIGLTQAASPNILSQLSLEREAVRILAATRPWARAQRLRQWLVRNRPRLLVAHSSPELTFLATLGTAVPYVLYQSSPPFYGGYSSNPYPHALRHRTAYRRLSVRTPGYLQFGRLPNGLRPLGRCKLEVRAFVKTLAMRRAAAVVVLSTRAAREIQALYGVRATSVRGCLDEAVATYVPSLDVRARHGLADRPLLVSVCRLEAVKRVDLLLRAFAEVRRGCPRAMLVVGGSGSEAERLDALARELGIRRDVVFTGFIPNEEVWDYFAAADVFVAPATADFNIAPYEALALGRKVVLSDELELEEWIAASGWVFRVPATVEAFSRAIQDALIAPHPAPLDLSTLTWSARVNSLLGCFQEAVGRHAPALMAAS